MAYYTYVLGRRPIKRTLTQDWSLAWGSLFHKLVEVWLRDRDLEKITHLIEVNIPPTIKDRYGRNQGRMVQFFSDWVVFNENFPLEVIAPEQSVIIGCFDACPYSDKGCGIAYGGRQDRIVKWNKLIGPLDVKTTVMNYKDPVAEYRPSHQIEGYVWMTTHLRGEHCWGGILEQAVCNSSVINIHRYPVPYTEYQIREWAETERLTHGEIYEKFRIHGYNEIMWKQNKGRCKKPYACTWRDVCLLPRETGFRFKFMERNTEEHRWDFTDPDRKEGSNAGTGA